MDDEELLKFAAIAGGIFAGRKRPEYEIHINSEAVHCLSQRYASKWSSLYDPEDAVSLAAQLRIHIEWVRNMGLSKEFVSAVVRGHGHCSHMEPLGDNPEHALCRAITIAAALRGKEIEQ